MDFLINRLAINRWRFKETAFKHDTNTTWEETTFKRDGYIDGKFVPNGETLRIKVIPINNGIIDSFWLDKKTLPGLTPFFNMGDIKFIMDSISIANKTANA